MPATPIPTGQPGLPQNGQVPHMIAYVPDIPTHRPRKRSKPASIRAARPLGSTAAGLAGPAEKPSLTGASAGAGQDSVFMREMVSAGPLMSNEQ